MQKRSSVVCFGCLGYNPHRHQRCYVEMMGNRLICVIHSRTANNKNGTLRKSNNTIYISSYNAHFASMGSCGSLCNAARCYCSGRQRYLRTPQSIHSFHFRGSACCMCTHCEFLKTPALHLRSATSVFSAPSKYAMHEHFEGLRIISSGVK